MVLVLQAICSFLFAVGALFILIDLRTDFDKSFRFFGLSLILLCAMTAIDLWVTPGMTDPLKLLFWQRVYHLLACLFMPFSIWYLLILTSSRFLKLMPVVAASSFLLASTFLSDKMLFISEGTYRAGILYNWLFIPFVLVYVLSSNFIIINKLRRSQAGERRILLFHLFGFLGLCACGILDIVAFANTILSTIPSFTILGVLGYGLMASMIFTERFLMLLNEKENNFTKLESAYKDLEQVNVLKQLGESTAIINHEIKNYMFMISGNAQILQEVETLSQKGKDIVNNIVTTVERLAYFSDDILKLSRTEVIREKHPVNLSEVIKGSVEKHFPGRRASFSLAGLERDRFMFGDWGKLEQVFVNIFNNSFEAGNGAPVEVRVKLTATETLLVIGIEDNGTGCDKEQLEHIFKAFYTTKKSKGGTGLGMSITRTIVESHGGRISAYSKNLGKKEEHGLKLIITFPIYAEHIEEEARRKHPIVVVKDGMDNMSDLIRVFQNIRVNPSIVPSVNELLDPEYAPDAVTVLVSAKTMAANFTKLAVYPQLCLVSHHERNQYVLDHGKGSRPEMFSEEYVLNRLLRRQLPRVRMKERQHHLVG
ncbi:MAG: histidine kinase [Fibrobacteres bacterium]|nr:histidine kinase [Fibrobacterota bacterium]